LIQVRAIVRAMSARLAVVLVVLLVSACGDAATADPRLATPERTVRTLLAAHGIAERDDVQARMIAEGGLSIVDREAYEACFADLDQPGGAGMAGYVLGLLAAARGELRYELFEQHAVVYVREGVRIAMRRGDDGAYRIVLAESVPADVRRSIVGLEAPISPATSRRPR